VNKQIFSQGLAYLGKNFEAIKPDAIDVYKLHLDDLGDQQFFDACKKLVEERKYKSFPTVAEIRYYAGIDLESISRDAIEKLKKALKRFPDCYSLCFSDKTLNAVANDYGNLEDMKRWGDEAWSYNYKRLIDLYSSYKRNGTTAERIKGHDERINHKYRIKYIGETGELPTTSEEQIPEKKSALLSYQDVINQIVDGCEDDESDNLPLILK